MEDSSRLSILARAAGVAFAAKVAMNAAQCFSNQENYRNFVRSLAAASADYVSAHSPDLPMALVTHFVHLPKPNNVTQLLDLQQPGYGDMFEAFLGEISNQNGVTVAFQRSGPIGFETCAVTLAEQTVSSIQKAAAKFRW